MNIGMLVLLALCTGTLLAQQPPITEIPVNTEVNISQSRETYTFYHTTVNNPKEGQVLMVTVVGQLQAFYSIYISSSADSKYTTRPTAASYTHECFYEGIDTCGIRLKEGDSIEISWSVYVDDDVDFEMAVTREKAFKVVPDQNYKIKFKKFEASLLELSGEDFLTQQVSVVGRYTSTKALGKFSMMADVNQLPVPFQGDTQMAEAVGFNAQILKLEKINATQSYMILVEAQLHTTLQILVRSVQPSPPLPINSTIVDLSTKPITYTYQQDFPTTLKPLFIDLFQMRGAGTFHVLYCDKLLDYSFTNYNGQNGEVIIDVDERQKCQQKVDASSKKEQLEVRVENIAWNVGYQIGFYEGNYEMYLYPDEMFYGMVIQNHDSKSYKIVSGSEDINFTLQANTLQGKLTFEVMACDEKTDNVSSCQTILSVAGTANQGLIHEQFLCEGTMQCSLIVELSQNATVDGQYQVSVQYSDPHIRPVSPNHQLVDIVEMNAYKDYMIDLAALRADPTYSFQNATLITIEVSVLNGQLFLLSSEKESPRYQDIFKDDSDVKYSWQGRVSYVVNQSEPDAIYLSVRGDVESLYYLQYSVNTSANVPQRYLSLVEDGQNQFELTSEQPYVLVKYSSHILPYSLLMSPLPSCISYGSSLPLPNQCMTVPKDLHQHILYFNISQDSLKDAFRFKIYVNTGSYILSQAHPLLIACLDDCYENVIVNVKQKKNVSIVHGGKGQISLVPDGDPVHNGKLVLECKQEPCMFEINANLPHGGDMTIAYQSEASLITWLTKPMSLPTDPKHFYLRLSSWSTEQRVMFYTKALQLSVYFSFAKLNQSYTNSLSYSYPTPQNAQYESIGDPLEPLHLITLTSEMLFDEGCLDYNVVCIALFTVTYNSSTEWSQVYLDQGVGYYSSNTYNYIISPNLPFSLRESYSVAKLTHKVQNTQPSSYWLTIRPISNCRPRIIFGQQQEYVQLEVPTLLGAKYIQYLVVSHSRCLFYTTLSTTPYQSVIRNMLYSLPASQPIILIYHHGYAERFQVWTSDTVDSITIGKFKQSQDGSVEMPDEGNNVGKVTQSSSITIDDAAFTTYTIVITPMEKKEKVECMVEVSSLSRMLLQNQVQTYTFAANRNQINYIYHSTSNFLLFVSVSKGEVQLSVSSNNQQILKQKININSSPWISVKSLNPEALMSYDIEVKMVSGQDDIPKLKIHTEEEGVDGLMTLYEGVPIIDAFLYEGSKNCYQFRSSNLVGRDSIEFVMQFLEAEGIEDGGVLATASLFNNHSALVSIQRRLTFTALSLEVPFYADSIYQVCLILNNPHVGIQYSIVASSPMMPLIPSNYLQQLPLADFSTYEFVNYFEQRYMWLEVVDCVGRSEVLTSSNYTDALSGRFTEIKSTWHDRHSSLSIGLIPHGYYYLSVKGKNDKRAASRLKVDEAALDSDGKPIILHKEWAISQDSESSIWSKWEGNTEFMEVKLSPVISKGTIKANSILYTLYVIDLTSGENPPHNVDTYVRCPDLLQGFKLLQGSKLKKKVGEAPTFSIPISELPQKCNISAQAQVLWLENKSIDHYHVVHYYYDYTHFSVDEGQSGSVLKPLLWILLTIGILVGLVALAYVIRNFLKRRKNSVPFQMAQFQQQMSSKSTPTTPAYGEFIDDS